MNSYEFFARKISCYEWPVLYNINDTDTFPHILSLKLLKM